MLRIQNNLLINKLKRRGNMKKILLMLSTLALMLAPAIANAGNFTMGVTFSDNSLDTDGTEDIDSNGTIDGEKNVTDDFMVGSIFAEYTNMGDRFGMIKFGSRVDVIVPKKWNIKVKEGDIVTAGETILYEL